MTLADQWLARMMQTMAAELGRGITAGLKSKELVELLLGIPEVAQALAMRANSRRDRVGNWILGEVPPEVGAEMLAGAADYLNDGFHERLVDELRDIAADLAPSSDQGPSG